MKNNLLIIGASGHGMVIADIAKLLNIDVIFCDDDPKLIEGTEVFARSNINFEKKDLIIGIGDNKTRNKISLQYSKHNFVKLLHPASVISKSSSIGFGSVVMAKAVINVGAVIGNHCIINTGAVIEHDCILEDYIHISPNATLCGSVKIGEFSWIGAGSVIIQGIEIGKNVTIGAGSVVINNIPNNSIVVGNPARIIKIK